MMLVAQRHDGTRFCLADSVWTKAQLIRIRVRESFYCPVCHARVVMKIGTKKSWHFAHLPKHPCKLCSEPETVLHLSGKKDLLVWMRTHGMPAELERYFPLFRQRADVYANNDRLALEFQCSNLSEARFIERTDGYRSSGIEPVWILGVNRLRRTVGFLRLSGFEPAAIRYPGKRLERAQPFASPFYLFFYDPNQRNWYVESQLHAVSACRFISREIMVPMRMFTPHQLFQPPGNGRNAAFKLLWNRDKRQRRLKSPQQMTSEEYRLRVWAYRSRKNFSCFPSFVGLPHAAYLYYLQPPCWWQLCLYYLMDGGGWFGLRRLNALIAGAGAAPLFAMRVLPQCPPILREQPIVIYLNQLTRLGFAQRKSNAWRLVSRGVSGNVEVLLQSDRRVLDCLEQGRAYRH
jgi:competence CoiA-like predicted nuclease